MPSLLALEPDFDRAALLRVVVDEHVRVPLTIVASVADAFAAIDRTVPDVILISPLTPASDETRLVDRLRALPKSACVQTLMLPDLTAPAEPPKRYGYSRRRPTRDACEPAQFAAHVNAYLEMARERRLEEPLTMHRGGAERRAATRRDCPARPEATINGAAVSLIDLSSTGAQVVSSSLLVPGRLVDLIVGHDDRTYRCRAAVVWGLFENDDARGGVSYRAGIDFKDGDGVPDALVQAPQHPAVIAPEEMALARVPATLARSRADRITASELPGLSTVRLPWGAEARLLNLSRTGVLVETFSKLTPGSSAAIKLCAQDSTVVVPARFVRSEVVTVDGRGVRYRAAAMFETAIDLDEFGISLPGASSTPKDVADWLRKLANEIHRGRDSAGLQRVLQASTALAAAVSTLHESDATQ